MSTIGPYQVLEDLGVVPFGTAYVAVDTRSDREVVLKMIPPSLRGASQQGAPWEILLDETRRLSRIYHRGIPTLLELAEQEGCLLVAFDPVEGISLHEFLMEGQRPDRSQLVEWGIELLGILEEAHAHGILHRHLGEDEIVLHPDGHLILTGFGLTQMVFDPLATPAPEQWVGDRATCACDLYAVGALLQRLAFASRLKSDASGRNGRERDPLLRVVARATSPDPAARFADAAEMRDALRQTRRAARARDRADRGRPAEAAPTPAAGLAVLPMTPMTHIPPAVQAPPAPAALRPVPRITAPAEDLGDRRRALLLLAAILLLLLTVLVAGWALIGPAGAPAASPQDAAPDAATAGGRQRPLQGHGFSGSGS